MADLADAFQCHVACALDGPFIILFHQQRADEADDGVVVGEDRHLESPVFGVW